jgi:tRNA 5-methylaminomethyl-2-thiouridine biosynthesis bifunctional protein
VTLIDKHAAPAQEASGNPAGVFHPLISRDDNGTSRMTRAGFLYALHRWRALDLAGHPVARGAGGLLHLADDEAQAQTIAEAMAAFAWPDHYVRPVSCEQAQHIAGVALARGGWFYPSGGWISPAALCAAQCAAASQWQRLDARFGVHVASIERRANEWFILDEKARVITCAPIVIFANAGDAARLARLAHAPTRAARGQVTFVSQSPLSALRVPVIGDGYALPMASHVTLTGATYDLDDTDTALRASSHHENLTRVAQMLPALHECAASAACLADNAPLAGRVALRCITSDRLPMLGPLADEALALHHARALSGAWPRDLPRVPGWYGAFAFGSRGLIWAALGAELIASQIEGEPWPIERELAERLDPARFLQRQLRRKTDALTDAPADAIRAQCWPVAETV